MTHLFAICIALFSNNLIKFCSADVCIWNAEVSPFVNGLYVQGSKSQTGDYSYSLPLASDCNQGEQLYLFNSILNRWTISSAWDSINGQYMKGNCSLQDTGTTLQECSTNWQIPAGISQASVTSNPASSCPLVQCDGLTISFPSSVSDACVGDFQHKESTNVYQKGTSGIYLYFNPSIFRWVCGEDGKTPNKCDSTYISEAETMSWWDADHLSGNGKTISIPWNNNMHATITCVGGPSSDDDTTLSTGAIIGIAIGGGCCYLICCCIAIIWFLKEN